MNIYVQTNFELVDFFKNQLLFYFGTFSIILGGFLIGRDYSDMKQFRFIEKKATRVLDPNFNVRVKYYRTSQIGIAFALIGIAFLFQNRLLSSFFLSRELFILFGLILIILGAILGGLNPTYFAKKANNL